MSEIKAVLFVHPAQDVSAIVSPSTRDIGCWQFTVVFKDRFPVEHFTFPNYQDACEEAVKRGFRAWQVTV
jgi:hypothetical protein